MKKVSALLLLFCGVVFGNACVSTAATSTDSNLATTWTSCGGVVPQPTDTVTIASHVNLTADFNVVSITINGAAAFLTTDGVALHTVTTSTGITQGGFITGSVNVIQGCAAVAGACTSGYAIDTSAASPGKEVVWVFTGIPSGQYIIISFPTVTTHINLTNCIFAAGNGRAVGIVAAAAFVGLNVVNSEILDGEVGIETQFSFVDTLLIDNVSSTGITTGPVVDVHSSAPLTCTLRNITEMNATSNKPVLKSDGNWGLCLIIGNAVLGDVAGVFDPTLILGNVSGSPPVNSVWAYNLGKVYHVGNDGLFAIAQCLGTNTFHCAIENNIVDGFTVGFQPSNFVDFSGNLAIARAAVTAEQGMWLGIGATSTTNFEDIVIANVSMSNNAGWFNIGNGTTPGNFTINRSTSILALDATGGQSGFVFGEGTGMDNLNVVTSALSNSIMYGGPFGVGSQNPDSTFVSSGTGSVGVYNNDYFGQVTAPASRTLPSTNFDNGVTQHPAAIYGDVTLDPKFQDTQRRWEQCDSILNGTGSGGTVVNLFTQLFNRWNGTANPGYTAPLIYNCMTAPVAPREIRLATVASDGSWVGAKKPLGLVGMAFQ